MEKVMNSVWGIVIFYLFIAILTFAVTICIKQNREHENIGDSYVAAIETANSNL